MNDRIEQDWTAVCELDDIVPDTGVCALVEGRAGRGVSSSRAKIGASTRSTTSIRIRRPRVLSRGIVGSLGERIVVASPIYKQHFDLRTGECLEAPELSVERVSRDGRGRQGVGRGMKTEYAVAGMASLRTSRAPAARGHRQRHGRHAHGRGAAEARARTCTTSPCSAPSRTATTTASCCRRCSRARRASTTSFSTRANGTTRTASRCMRAMPVVAIDRARRIVRSQKGVEARYDRLLIATGSKPFIIPVPGCELPGVIAFRDIQDVETMLEARARSSSRGGDRRRPARARSGQRTCSGRACR